MPNLPIPGNGTHNVIFVATEKDSVFAFDADANPCKQLWKSSLIPTGSQAVSNGNTQIVPFVGITGTPVIDLSASVLYVVAARQTIQTEIGVPPTYSHWLYALDLASGNEVIQPPGVEITSPDSRIRFVGRKPTGCTAP